MCTVEIAHAIAIARRCRHLYDADIQYRSNVKASFEFYRACIAYCYGIENIPGQGTPEYEEIIIELERCFSGY